MQSHLRSEALLLLLAGCHQRPASVDSTWHATLASPAGELPFTLPAWIPGRIFLSYLVGAILILAGICLIVNLKTRTAATVLGLTVFLAILLVSADPDRRAERCRSVNYFFDTLLFCGTILMLAIRSTTLPA